MGGAEIWSDSPPDEPPVTVVTGRFQDQAALAGASTCSTILACRCFRSSVLTDPQRSLIPPAAIAPAALAAQPPGELGAIAALPWRPLSPSTSE